MILACVPAANVTGSARRAEDAEGFSGNAAFNSPLVQSLVSSVTVGRLLAEPFPTDRFDSFFVFLASALVWASTSLSLLIEMSETCRGTSTPFAARMLADSKTGQLSC